MESEPKLGVQLAEGKTKVVMEIADDPTRVLIRSKDQITAFNMVRCDQLEGKASLSTKTTSCVFKLLQEAGIKTAFEHRHNDVAFMAKRCTMVPIEWVCRRVATGSFLKRNPGVVEGYRFSPPKLETFLKDDANNDPQWSTEQIIAKGLSLAGRTIGRAEVDLMLETTAAIFDILEKMWTTQDCCLVDMKVEYGVCKSSKEILLADVIDNDSWRLWPAGDRTQQKDKQVYRDLKEVTPESLKVVKKNFEWVAERVELLLQPTGAKGRVVVIMGSASDEHLGRRLHKAIGAYGVPCHLRVSSAHKGPDQTLSMKNQYESDGVPTVFVAIAGRSNGLGPVLSGNTAYPVINCPPLSPEWGAQDVWSSLRMPTGIGCTTVLSPEAAALAAAQILALNEPLIWSRLRAQRLNTWAALQVADCALSEQV
uniref:bifunctional phosphoribosylaminoimidazole carboxylase/phosphoribosylaminoimidazole succinocarboxamide synthetase n=1 Tax=Myxine glutinosa TaxID=7769 RepID=UPI00358F1B83